MKALKPVKCEPSETSFSSRPQPTISTFMPVCTNCAAYVDCVYTQYSANNIRLEQCVSSTSEPSNNDLQFVQKQCSEIADHDIEQDPLNLTLDLILLKGVLIHLLYNRGSNPRHIDRNGSVVLPNVETERNMSEKVEDDVRKMDINSDIGLL